MLTNRIIPCLDVFDGQVVKGVQFKNHERVGSIIELAEKYNDQGADELVFYDIKASTNDSTVSLKWVKEIAKNLSIPFCVAGGIKTVDDAKKILNAGADKVSINTPAIENPYLIKDLSNEFGRQCVVVLSFSLRSVRSVTLLPKELSRTQEKTRAHLPTHHIRPLVYQKRKVSVALNPLSVCIPNNSLRRRTHNQLLLKLRIRIHNYPIAVGIILQAVVSNYSALLGKTLNVVSLFRQVRLGDEKREIGVRVACFLEHYI